MEGPRCCVGWSPDEDGNCEHLWYTGTCEYFDSECPYSALTDQVEHVIIEAPGAGRVKGNSQEFLEWMEERVAEKAASVSFEDFRIMNAVVFKYRTQLQYPDGIVAYSDREKSHLTAAEIAYLLGL